MAIYHFSAQTISRSQGRSSVAAAAYRAGELLHDERLGKTYDFTKKNDVLEKEILLPDGALEWMQDREALWNAVEKKENRKDAQSAREINIALPKELNQKQNWELAKAFVSEEFVSKGMVADLTFHAGGTKLDTQPHMHVMLTMREITEEGFGQKVRDWNEKGLLKSWREHWSERCNLELARHGFDIQIDHRSLDAQGIDLEPQSKIGAKSAQIKMARMVEHQELAERNGERLKANPEIALEAITRQQSTFTHHDLARFVNRHTKDEVQFTEVYDLVKASTEIVYLGKDDANRERYTTKDMLRIETEMLATANKLNASHKHLVTESHQKAALETKTLSPEQLEAFNHLVSNKDLVCVIGYAGTGKSYCLGAAREAWEYSDLRVTGATLSGIAAENLESGSGIKSYTVANRLWHWERGNDRLTDKDVLVIDEVGMLGSRQMNAVLAEVAKANAKVAIIGDFEQLQAIEAGAAGRAIAQEVGAVTLTDIRRQSEPWQQEATKNFAEDRTKEGLLAYEQHDNIHKFVTRAEAVKCMVEQWDEVRSQSPEKSQIMLAYTKAEVKDLNDYARSLCRNHYELGQDFGVKTSRGIRDFATGDRVYFLRNENYNLHVKNGTLGTITKLDGRNFAVKLDHDTNEGRIVTFNINDYRDLDHGYAATIHKAQGITVDRVHVLASKYFDRHTTYVAMSRHREGADLYYNREEFAGFNELTRILGRERAKDVTLDYTQTRNLEAAETTVLKNNNIEIKQQYSMVLTQERVDAAASRLAERQYNNALTKELSAFSEKTKLNYSLALEAGVRGTYIGQVELVGRKYGIIQQENAQAKLMPLELFTSQEKGKEVKVEMHLDKEGQEVLKGVQPEVKHSRGFEREEHGFGIGIGGFSR